MLEKTKPKLHFGLYTYQKGVTKPKFVKDEQYRGGK